MGEKIQIWNADQSEECILPHHQGISENRKYHGSYTEVHQVLHDDVARILRTGETGLHHGKAALHEKNQNRPDKKPY